MNYINFINNKNCILKASKPLSKLETLVVNSNKKCTVKITLNLICASFWHAVFCQTLFIHLKGGMDDFEETSSSSDISDVFEEQLKMQQKQFKIQQQKVFL